MRSTRRTTRDQLSHAGFRRGHPRRHWWQGCRPDSRHPGWQLSQSQSCRAGSGWTAGADWADGWRDCEHRSPSRARATIDDHRLNIEAAIGRGEGRDRHGARSGGLAAARGRHREADRLQDVRAGRRGCCAFADGIQPARRQDRADNVASGLVTRAARTRPRPPLSGRMI